MRILVTGGAGFVGSALVRHLIQETGHSVLNVDKLTYAATCASLAAVANHPRYEFLRGDIRDQALLADAFRRFRPEAVMHLAAETHVDRSIDGPEVFVETNVAGTLRLLEAARAYWIELKSGPKAAFRFHHVSTDEVFGALAPDDPPFSERSPHRPSSPYAASKAAADHLVRAWGQTYGLPILTTHSSNNFGPYQFPEKLIPLMILKALRGEPLPVYGNGGNIRDWLFVEDHAEALARVVESGRPGETYLIGGAAERTNLNVVLSVTELLDELAAPLASGKKRAELVAFTLDRPGHDFRYALDCGKVERELGWRPRRSFDAGLRRTVVWFLENESWWGPLVQRYGGERLGVSSRPDSA